MIKKKFIIFVVLLMVGADIAVHADIVLDGTIGNTGTLTLQGPDYDVRAKYGQQAGTNLFHSFSIFNINTNESATFSGPDAVQNIIARVTGGSSSWIDGKVSSSIIGADIYLLNPAGVMFGPKASLNLSGSFHVSTADYLRMGEKEQFLVRPFEKELLSAESPTAFGFLNSDSGTSGSIFLDNSQLNAETISVVGGNIEMKKSTLKALGGRINMASVASDGIVVPTKSGLNVSSFEQMGNITLSENSFVDANGKMPGNIFISSGYFFAENSSLEAKAEASDEEDKGVTDIQPPNLTFAESGKFFNEQSGDQHGDIEIIATESVNFSSGSNINTRFWPYGSVNTESAGNVLIEAKNIFFTDTSGIRCETVGGNKGGNVTIRAYESASFSDMINSSAFIDHDKIGYGGDILIEAKNISFINGGGINSHINGKGKGGDVNILASESVHFYSTDGKPASTIHTTTFGKEENAGNAGDISIKADIISFQNSGGVSANSEGTGNAGDIILEANRLEMDSGALVSSASNSENNAGDAGTITIWKKLEENGAITPCDSIIMLDNSSVTTQAEHAGGGKISMSAEKLLYMKDSRITSRVKYGDRDGGNISIGNPIFTILNHSNIIAKAYEGRGGNISIVADHFIQSSDSEIDASSEFGVDGQIEIISPDADITNSLSVLPSDFPDAARWMKTPCSERSGEEVSRFVLSERDGLPASPDDWLASPPSAFDRSDTVMQTEKPGQLLTKGEEFYRKGDFENAAQTWEQAIPLLDKGEDIFLNTLAYLAYSYQMLGHYQKALSILHSQLPAMEKSKDQYYNALFSNSLGDIYLSLGNMDKAEQYFEKAIKQARSADSSALMAKIQNNMGNFLAAGGNHQEAMKAYTKSLESSLNNAELKSVIFINTARLTLQVNDYMEQDIISPLEIALLQTENLPDSHNKASNSVSLALLSQKISQTREIKNSIKSGSHFKKIIFNSLTLAKQLAENLEDTRMASYACGYLGQLYEEEMQYQEAMKLTRKAIFFAQQTYSPEILYLWQWQLGRLFKAKQDIENSIKAYTNAIDTLNPVRKEFFYGYRGKPPSFYENIKPVYLGLAELLLKQAENSGDKSPLCLFRARDTMELLKKAELQNFFQDECVTAAETKTKITRLDRTPSHTAVIYPISLHDHLVLLLTLPDSIKQIKVPVDSETIRERVQRFVNLLENVEDNRFRYYAKQLYNWLIGPVENELTSREIDTLIIVPDGMLRLIPFSALHDGEHFLVEKYALATVPAITLTDLEPIKLKNARILLSGLSEASQGFPALVNVAQELEEIKKIVGGKIIKDQEYTNNNLAHEFKNHEYSVIHMATHGNFGGTPQDTFLLTYDGKLTFNGLEKLISLGRFRENPIELLTLSACQTALGDELAALGLSGVALRAGVKSTIAALWRIDDKTTSLVITEFYRQLRMPENISKAKALRNAQKSLIAQSDYNHPAYWAPFLLIGNWM